MLYPVLSPQAGPQHHQPPQGPPGGHQPSPMKTDTSRSPDDRRRGGSMDSRYESALLQFSAEDQPRSIPSLGALLACDQLGSC
jgi:hypothetical protein